MQIIKNDPVERREGLARRPEAEQVVPAPLFQLQAEPEGEAPREQASDVKETAAPEGEETARTEPPEAEAGAAAAEAEAGAEAGETDAAAEAADTEPAPAAGQEAEAAVEQQPAEAAAGEELLSLVKADPPAAEEVSAVEQEALADSAVTAHTASLWKYLPLPADEPENSPQYAADYQEFAGGRLFAARVRGKKHKHEGTNCDDWMELAHCGELGDIAIIIVSDGAGSRHYSRIGSRESCQAAMSSLKRGVTELEARTDSLRSRLAGDFSQPEFAGSCGQLVQLVQQAVLAGREAVVRAFEARRTDEAYMKPLGRELELQDFAATLLVTVVIPVPRLREQLIISCQVGDGMIAALDTKGEFPSALRLLAEADSGQFAGETDFLTSSKMASLAELQRRTKVSRCSADLVMAMTDGVSDDYDPPKPGLFGLYYDLMANNVLTAEPVSVADLSPAQAELLKRTPAPQGYPWVNNPEQLVYLQYEEKLVQALGMSYEELWQQPELLRYASLGVSIRPEDRPEQKLQQWLDNCTRRGSFDDRTLALLQLRRRP